MSDFVTSAGRNGTTLPVDVFRVAEELADAYTGLLANGREPTVGALLVGAGRCPVCAAPLMGEGRSFVCSSCRQQVIRA